MGLWLSDLGLTLALLAVTELMFRLGRRGRPRHDEAMRSQITTVQASALGLLALILGFTMSMAESRFNARRQIIVAEAAAIGTTYLRADFMPEPERRRARDLLRDYVEARRAYFRATEAEAPATTARAQAIQVELWTIAANVGRAHPDWDIFATYVESLNETIDLEAMRDVSVASRLPETIRALLVLIALVAAGVTGYATGLNGARNTVSLYIVPIMIAVSCGVVGDLDRSRAGFISTGDLAMARLQRTLTGDHAALAPSSMVEPR